MRTPPPDPPLLPTPSAQSDVRVYEFVTPVFGGGVEPKQTDPRTPVRVASVRGQLRFWWRAVNPRGCTTVDELRAAEADVFGSTASASPLIVRVKKQPAAPKPLQVLEGKFRTKAGMEDIAYGAFPLRNENDESKHGVLHEFKEPFELAFSYPPQIAGDVDAALWGWAHFGGLGGRTRRGFGAVAQRSPALVAIDEGWTRFVSGRAVAWPHLANKPVVAGGREPGDGLAALKVLLGALRRIRQGRGVGRRRGEGNTPGRSFWPEADSIRRILGRSDPAHGESLTGNTNVFPRGAFGMPIIFHFKGDRDPADTTLLPQGLKRMASRLILRPHQRPDGRIEAMAVLLAPALDGGFELVQGGRGDAPKPVDIALKVPIEIGQGHRFTDPIARFFEELRK
jgi:CRISPR-associated protein Cmr1